MRHTISTGAAYNSEERSPASACHPGTHVDLLKEVMEHIQDGVDEEGKRVIWLHGPAGAGKSAIAQTIAENFADLDSLAASFFFSRQHAGRDTVQLFFPTIAYQIAMSIPKTRPFVLKNFMQDPSIISKSPGLQVQKLIIEPLQSLRISMASRGGTRLSKLQIPYLVIVDALNECANSEKQSEVLDHIIHLVNTPSFPLRFLIVSRPDPHIQKTLETTKARKVVTPILLYEVVNADADVRTYLLDEFARISSSTRHHAAFSGINEHWPTNEDISQVVQRSDGSLMYASLLIRHVDEESFSPVERLAAALNTSSCTSNPRRELDNLCLHILSQSPNPDLLKKILGYIVGGRGNCAHQTGRFISQAHNLGPDQLSIAVRGCRSIFSDKIADDLYYPFHSSFDDFIFHADRAGDFHLDEKLSLELRLNAYLKALKVSHESRTPMLEAADVIEDLHSRLSSMKGTLPDTTVQILLATNVHFWRCFFTNESDLYLVKESHHGPQWDRQLLTWLAKFRRIFSVG
ncbi:hypothetical protein FPV67DRAFT_1419664 [Lyophyllum atratum]|nr:hypothetical protein FPV67DRAFT_1419664 [Lyophyllum atratum]